MIHLQKPVHDRRDQLHRKRYVPSLLVEGGLLVWRQRKGRVQKKVND